MRDVVASTSSRAPHRRGRSQTGFRACRILAIAVLGFTVSKAEAVVFPGATWEKRTPASVGLDERKLAEFAARVGGDGCVIKDGYLVKSWGNITVRRDWASAAKPVLSTMLLLAVQHRKLHGVDARVKDVGWKLAPKDSTMTFRHLANMVSGYARGEPPGAAWGYNDRGVRLLGLSLERAFGQPLDAVSRERLAALRFEDGGVFGSRGGIGVDASVRDFARLGWLWLNGGRWKSKSVLSRRLIGNCFRPGVPAELPRTTKEGRDYLGIGTYGGGTDQTHFGPGIYGFNFWFNERLPNGQRVWPAVPADTYQANGMWNRDTLTVFPSLRMVVAIRGADPGPFEPGRSKGKYNQNLKRLMDAVHPRPDGGDKKRR